MPFGTTHTGLRALAKYATQSFFSRIQVDGAENVPADGEGPLLAVAVSPALQARCRLADFKRRTTGTRQLT